MPRNNWNASNYSLYSKTGGKRRTAGRNNPKLSTFPQGCPQIDAGFPQGCPQNRGNRLGFRPKNRHFDNCIFKKTTYCNIAMKYYRLQSARGGQGNIQNEMICKQSTIRNNAACNVRVENPVDNTACNVDKKYYAEQKNTKRNI
ncbi:MAG: hypothetical protein ACI4PV_08300 [Butyricicoccus sp.]